MIKYRRTIHRHPFHMVDPSPWPLVVAIGVLSMTLGAVMLMNNFSGGYRLFCVGISIILCAIYCWWRDVIREAVFEGHHTFAVQKGLRLGMILFIVSEVMFFFAFFWAFFASSLSPVFNIGGVWPPVGLEVISPWGLPLLNTLILLSSGACVTWAHHAIVGGYSTNAIDGLLLTLALAIDFTIFQLSEYIHAPFSIADGVYGSIFFLTTGFHGFHVIIGTIFLGINLIRLYLSHFSTHHHFGFEAAAWYWHFVDVVWLILFIAIYWWGG